MMFNTIRRPRPPDRYPAPVVGQCPIFNGVGCKLVQHHRRCLRSFWLKCYAWAADFRIACGVGRKFTPDEFGKRYAMPTAVAQQLVGARQGLDAMIDRSHEVGS